MQRNESNAKCKDVKEIKEMKEMQRNAKKWKERTDM